MITRMSPPQSRRWLAAPAIGLTTLLLAWPSSVGAQEDCLAGTAEQAWIGVHAFHCPGGPCNFHVFRDDDSAARYEFSSEPWLRVIDSDGPGAGILREGDVLVAVNGFLITTTRGGTELASLAPGVETTVTVRRGDRLERLQVIPEIGCKPFLFLSGNTRVNVPTWSEGSRLEYRDGESAGGGAPSTGESGGSGGASSRPKRRGLVLACSDCSIHFDPERGFEWALPRSLEVRAVARGSAADIAGLRKSDRLLAVNGHPVDTHAAGDALFGSVERDLHLTIERAGEQLDFTLAAPVGERALEFDVGAVLRRGSGGWNGSALGNVLSTLRGLSIQRLSRTLLATRLATLRLPRLPPSLTISGDSWGPSSLGATFDCNSECAWILDGQGEVVWELRRYLVVKEVEPDGAAARAGLLPGDVLLSINGHDLLTPEASALFGHSGAGVTLEIVVRRGGNERTLTLVTR